MTLHRGGAKTGQFLPGNADGILQGRAKAGKSGAEYQSYGFVSACKTALRVETGLQRRNGKLDFWEILHQNAS